MSARSRDRCSNGAAPAPAEAISRRLAQRIGPRKYDMWFGHARLQVENGTLQVATNSPFVARWIDAHFSGDLEQAAQPTLGEDVRIRVSVKPELLAAEPPAATAAVPMPVANGEGRKASFASTFRRLAE